MVQNGFDGCFPRDGGKRNQVGASAGSQFAQFASRAQSPRRIDCQHGKDPFRRRGRKTSRKLASLLQEAQFQWLFALFRHAGEAVRGKANVHAAGLQRLKRKLVVPKIGVTPRAMDDVGTMPGKQFGIAGSKIIHMDGKQ